MKRCLGNSQQFSLLSVIFLDTFFLKTPSLGWLFTIFLCGLWGKFVNLSN